MTEELGSDELIRRLKSLAHTFQVLQQAEDESTYVDYTPLALHLADDFFLNHASRDVQLLVRYCFLMCSSHVLTNLDSTNFFQIFLKVQFDFYFSKESEWNYGSVE